MSITKKRVLELLEQGWELGTSNGVTSGAWMQKDGLGRGGPSEQVHASSFRSLCQSGQIVRLPKRKSDAWYLTRYGLAQHRRGEG